MAEQISEKDILYYRFKNYDDTLEDAEESLKQLEAIVRPTPKPKRKTIHEIIEDRATLRNIYRPEKGRRPRVKIPQARPAVEISKKYEKKPVPDKIDKIVFPDDSTKYEKEESLDMPKDELAVGRVELPKQQEVYIPESLTKPLEKIVEQPNNYQSDFTLYDITQLFKSPTVNPATGDMVELVGGEDVSVLSTLCYINSICFGVEGDSGSGKSLIMDKWLEMIQPDELITIKQATNKALHNMTEEINTKKWVYFSELQKIASGNNGGKAIVELLKNLSEGRPAKFSYYVSRNKTENITINPINVCYTRALENSWDLDRELSRRFVKLVTESGIEHTNEVNQKQLENWTRMDFDGESRSRRNEELKQHIYQISRLENVNYIDPFAFAFGERIRDIPKSNCFIPQYGNLLRASAKFHFNQREQFRYSDKLYLVLELEDHYNVSEAYHDHFMKAMSIWNEQDIETNPVEWTEYFHKGVKEMLESSNLESLRKMKLDFVSNWIDKQQTNGELYVTDFKTGDRKKLGIYNEP